MSKIVVTGGDGYIGSKLVARLNAESYDTKQNKDVLDYPQASTIFHDAHLIFHLGAVVSKLAAMEHRKEAIETNVLGTLNVLECCRKFDVDKLVNVSSSEVLGDPVYLPTDEKHPCKPKSTYGISKLAAELLCNEYRQAYGLHIITARPFMVYGPDDFRDLRYASAISKFIHAAVTGTVPTVYEDCSRAWLNVDDCVDALVLLGEKAENGVYDITVPPNQSLSMSNLCYRILALCNQAYHPLCLEAPKLDTRVKLASGSKMWLEFEWKPKHCLLDDLPLMVQEYRTFLESSLCH